MVSEVTGAAQPDDGAASGLRGQSRTQKVVLAGVFSGMVILLGLVPSIGFIPVPTPAGNATTLHIPVILAGMLAGPAVGAVVGLTFGLFSFLRATTPIFKDPLVAILPRLFIGVVAWAVYAGALRARRGLLVVIAALAVFLAGSFAWQVHLHRPTLGSIYLILVLAAGAALVYFLWAGKPEAVAVVAGAVLGSFTNTALVLGMAALLGYLPVQGVLLVAITHGIPEAIVAAVIASAVIGALHGTTGRQRSDL